MNKLGPTSKIGRQDAINGSAKGKNKPVAGKPASAKNIDRVTLSETSKAQASASEVKSVASEIRRDLVNKFRNIILVLIISVSSLIIFISGERTALAMLIIFLLIPKY